MEGTLAEVRMFAGNFAPRSWAFCHGQLLPINSNSALFSLIGTIYGGDGRTTFALPDCRGRQVYGPGNGPGLSSYREGQKGGVESVILNQTQIPSHTHSASGNARYSTAAADSKDPTNRNFALAGINLYTNAAPNVDMAADTDQITIANNGGNLSHTNMAPWIAMHFIIAIQGVFPSRS